MDTLSQGTFLDAGRNFLDTCVWPYPFEAQQRIGAMAENSMSGGNMQEEAPSFNPRLVASTSYTYSRSIKDTPEFEEAAREGGDTDTEPASPRSGPFEGKNQSNYFKSINW